MNFLACCGNAMHPWDQFEVESRWLPRSLRCLVVGENPGAATSEYFYACPASYGTDTVVIRMSLLRGLHQQGLILEATLGGFQDAGFLFDHAIRCPLSAKVVARERQNAMRYASRRVRDPVHLRIRLAHATVVWVMGHLASNAVANATGDFPKQRRQISKLPYPGPISRRSKFFVSEYFTWRNESAAPGICEAFAQFAREKFVFDVKGDVAQL